MPRKNLAGGKITSSHTTMTDATLGVVDRANRLSEVTKIVLGVITPVRGGRRDLKFLTITGGVKAVVRGSGAVQDIYIYTKAPERVTNVLSGGFNK